MTKPPDNMPLHKNRPGETKGSGAPVPPTRDERERLLGAARHYAAARRLVPPFSIEELRAHSKCVLAAARAEEKYRKFVAVLVSNEAWRDAIAAVPFDRRLLLLPKCLRCESDCAGSIDEFGLVCADCGRCSIHLLKNEAERLGYAVLVAEGAAVVMALIEARKIEAVVGVSCMAALESIYPLMESAAVPGIAIPLLYDGCSQTATDFDWVWDAIHLNGGPAARRVDIEALRRDVESWFAADALESALGPPSGETERIARAWLARSGKRWRPLLAVCACRALGPEPGDPPPDAIRRIALAVECFHKASLVHDDIEDGDPTRYGEQTLHRQYGTPVALNVGDFLLGEGYRLIAESGLPSAARAEMLRAAARGHRDLTIGQGSELCWARSPAPLAPDEVIDIFRRKTAPAFEVALRLGAIAGGAPTEVWDVLHRYSEALGVAYQVWDDLKDCREGGDGSDLLAMRPSILLAVAHQRASGGERRFFDALWRRAAPAGVRGEEVLRRMADLGVEAEAERLVRTYEEEAIRCLEPLTSGDLKALLRRVLFLIFRRTSCGS
jgi:geranylgeranyl pyrophosphate synthase